MKIELCLLTVNLLAGLAEVTWYLQSLPGEKKVIYFYISLLIRKMSVNHNQNSLFWLFFTRLTTLLMILSTHRHSTNSADICQCCFCVQSVSTLLMLID
jgi:hypothetical protein